MCAVSSVKRTTVDNLGENDTTFKRPKEELIPIGDILAHVVSDLSTEVVRDCPNKPLANAPTRESRAVEEENIGVIEFRIVFNNPNVAIDQEDIMRLVAAKSLFAYQLPKIPREYITRLVFDSRHKCLVLCKNGQVVGGLCFRPFPHQGFTEIVFCAISTSEQVKGYGTRMMNHLKDYHIRQRIYNFLTYADEFAIGYFKKQGFSKNVQMSLNQYQGYIKEYQGATLMECVLDANISYTDLSNRLRRQRRLLTELIRKRSEEIGVIQPGIEMSGEINIEDIPGIENTGWKRTSSDDLKEMSFEKDLDKLYTVLKNIYNQLKSHPSSWPFLKPVSSIDVPDYYEVVKNPMDFKTMGDKLKSKFYTNIRVFFVDMTQIFMNCRVYNDKQTEYYDCANNLEQFFHLKLREAGFL
ncbi:Histone acetyltransferase KAT2B-like [Oopsacas minuta]|uniref:histone acetyltransferase n=1 Tax=Oopsacas minuta TaxID=111878 RepID=A0AAV7JIY9_9METZ|nr:Histone acetyltransferase KAT2B-like [Oopsacas minuta]